MTFLAALRHDRITAPWFIDEPINGETFQLYIEKVPSRRVWLVRGRSDDGQECLAGMPLRLQNAGFIWVPFVIASAFAAWFGMNDIASAN
jgi:nitrate/nitrite transporter NarK